MNIEPSENKQQLLELKALYALYNKYCNHLKVPDKLGKKYFKDYLITIGYKYETKNNVRGFMGYTIKNSTEFDKIEIKHLLKFIDSEIEKTYEVDDFVESWEFYKKYRNWCKVESYCDPFAQEEFMEVMNKAGFEYANEGIRTGYKGMKFKTNSDCHESESDFDDWD